MAHKLPLCYLRATVEIHFAKDPLCHGQACARLHSLAVDFPDDSITCGNLGIQKMCADEAGARMQACTASMNLSEEVDLEDYVSRPDKISNAEISAICQEAGMHAVRKNRYVILPKDFEKGYKANVKKSDTDFDFYQ